MTIDFNALLNEAAAREKGEKAWDNADPDITYQGTQITLPGEPGPMPTEKAIRTLQRKLKDENTMMEVHEIIEAHPHDALVAFNRAMKEKYGWSSPTPQQGWFGEISPTLLTVKTGPGPKDSIQVPHGMFTLPGVENPIETKMATINNMPVLVIQGTVRKRESAVVKELAQYARELLAEHSIYKGQAVRLKVNENGDLMIHEAPIFMKTKHIEEKELILNPEEHSQLRAGLWSVLRNTAACIKHNIPLNRGVLLEGPYGTGKTMAATVTSKICVDNNWTYILLDDVRALKEALLFAQRYQPAVIFAEDADRVSDKRDQRGNDLLNTIDGVLTKDAQVITVLTTNFVERLDPAMLRPGRLDTVISIRPPEAEAVEKLIRLYARGTLAEDANLTEVAARLAGNIPATIREVVERSKLTMLLEDRSTINTDDLTTAAISMERHLELLAGKKPEPTKEHQFGAMMIELISPTVHEKVVEGTEEMAGQVERLYNRIM